MEGPASCSQVFCTQHLPWDIFQFFSDHFDRVSFTKEVSGTHCHGFFCPFSDVTPREGTPRALLLFSLPLHLLLSSQVPVAAFKNSKCVLILVHLGNNCFYFRGEEKRRKNSLGLNNHLSLQPSTLFMRLFFFKIFFLFHPASLVSSWRWSIKLPLQRLYMFSYKEPAMNASSKCGFQQNTFPLASQQGQSWIRLQT